MPIKTKTFKVNVKKKQRERMKQKTWRKQKNIQRNKKKTKMKEKNIKKLKKKYGKIDNVVTEKNQQARNRIDRM